MFRVRQLQIIAHEPNMLPVFSLCLLLLVNTCAAYSDNEVGITVSTQCVDNDALTKETYAAIESAIKVLVINYTVIGISRI